MDYLLSKMIGPLIIATNPNNRFHLQNDQKKKKSLVDDLSFTAANSGESNSESLTTFEKNSTK